MHWYGGSIAEAVNLSKQRNAIFVVFVEGENDLSTEMASTIDDTAVMKRLADQNNFLAIKLKSGSPNYTHFAQICENDLSTEMASTIDDTAVMKRLADQNNFLAIKLKSGSPNYTHFAQIYQFVPVPSLFFIGRNGTPLEVVCAGVQAGNLASRIDRILEEHHKEKAPVDLSTPSMQPSTSSQNIKEQTTSLLQSEATVATALVQPKLTVQPETSEPAAKIQKTEHHEVTKSGQEYDVVCDGDVCVRKPRVTKQDEAGPSQRQETDQSNQPMESALADDSVSMEEKLEKAKEVIEARRREKVEKEKELERQKELERRNQGQGVAELKRWQADQEMKQIQEERKREKMENNLVRQRILEQIAQDRAERRARDQPPPAATTTLNAEPNILRQIAQDRAERRIRDQPPSTTTTDTPEPTSGDGGSRARVQFKLPDGTSHTAHFDADNTLGDIQRYISDNLQLTTSSFSLWTAFPRRELTETNETLRRLELAPSAALLVLPRRQPTTVATPGALATLLTFFTQFFTSFILQPSQQIYNWIRSRFTPPPTETSPSPPPRHSPPPNIRRRGNIHRLPGERATDDDNNTWNGNSTQQM